MITTRAPAPVSACNVGRLARIRPSSVITAVPELESSGTLKSERTRTVRPLTPEASRSSRVFIPNYSLEATSAVKSTRRLV